MLHTNHAYTAVAIYLFFGGGSLLILSTDIGSDGTAHSIASALSRFTIRACGIILDANLAKLTPDQTYIFISSHQRQVKIPILIALLAPFKKYSSAKHTTISRISLLDKVMHSRGCIRFNYTHGEKTLKALHQTLLQHPVLQIIFHIYRRHHAGALQIQRHYHCKYK